MTWRPSLLGPKSVEGGNVGILSMAGPIGVGVASSVAVAVGGIGVCVGMNGVEVGGRVGALGSAWSWEQTNESTEPIALSQTTRPFSRVARLNESTRRNQLMCK